MTFEASNFDGEVATELNGKGTNKRLKTASYPHPLPERVAL